MKFKRVVDEGVRKSNDSFIVDYTYDAPEDLITLKGPTLHESEIFGNAYYFGYEFTSPENGNSRERAEFINYIKGLSDKKMPEHELRQFIERPLVELDKRYGLQNIDCIACPISGRSELTTKIVRSINDYSPREAARSSFELIKKLPSEVKFDWNLFDLERGEELDKVSYNQIRDYVNNEMLPRIHSLDYFSIARDTKPKYRRYLYSYLQAKNERQVETLRAIGRGDILVVDDINTSRSTLNEICRIIRSINPDCQLFIFTLIGKA